MEKGIAEVVVGEGKGGIKADGFTQVFLGEGILVESVENVSEVVVSLGVFREHFYHSGIVNGGLFEALIFFKVGGETETDQGFGAAAGEVDLRMVDESARDRGGFQKTLINSTFEFCEVCEEGVNFDGAFINRGELPVSINEEAGGQGELPAHGDLPMVHDFHGGKEL